MKKIKKAQVLNQNSLLYFLIASLIFLSCSFQDRKSKSAIIKIYAIDWYSYTKNRITKKKITETENIFVSKINDIDSLNFILSTLTPTIDTIYNLRMCCEIKKAKEIKQIFIDKNGTIEFNKNYYNKNEALMKYLLKLIPSNERKSFTPEWVH